MFKSIHEVRVANKSSGYFFFSRNTMRFFDSRIESKLYHGRFFITSEQLHGSLGSNPRKYTIRYAKDDGGITPVRGNEFKSINHARTLLKYLTLPHDKISYEYLHVNGTLTVWDNLVALYEKDNDERSHNKISRKKQ